MLDVIFILKTLESTLVIFKPWLWVYWWS